MFDCEERRSGKCKEKIWEDLHLQRLLGSEEFNQSFLFQCLIMYFNLTGSWLIIQCQLAGEPHDNKDEDWKDVHKMR